MGCTQRAVGNFWGSAAAVSGTLVPQLSVVPRVSQVPLVSWVSQMSLVAHMQRGLLVTPSPGCQACLGCGGCLGS